MRLRALTVPVLALAVLAGLAPPAHAQGAAVSAAEKAAAAEIRDELLLGHIRFLSHDLLEGRGPATRGDALTQAYVAAMFEAEGLEPAGPDGSWFQPFDIVGVSSHAPATTSLRKDAQGVDLRLSDDYVAVVGGEQARSELQDAELVFVGYGIVAPEYQWDDFKGADLKGKVLVMMNNDPEDDPALFAGKTRLYYGRWDYKFESAARQGAAGAIVIHTTPSAGYGWNVIQSSWSGEQFALPYEGGPQLAIKSWVTEESARKLAQLGGQDLDALRAAAQKRDFKPVPLGVRWTLAVTADVKKKQTANVLGRIPGRDAALAREAVIYSAHHDHLGMREAKAAGEDVIYNGASDNATGVAALLAIARAMKALPQAPRRSVIFAAVAAEEQGLLGAKYFAAHPTLPPGRMAANINIDGLPTAGRARDLTMIGMGKSTLDDHVKALVAMQGRVLVPDQFPDRGFFYRSDQFALAKIGVPAAYFDEGTDVIGKPAGYGRKKKEEFEAKDYHQPSDVIKPDWDLSGAVEDIQLFFYLGTRVANDSKMPSWRPGDEFEAARKKALAAAR
ncbi:MAG TPA: M20/M25/M40 family metallo-hydrolase [Vicinamibacteria bacterium]|nr:M20/M25/M40 family metallo-hydrolase [Vicinamibacteria bacterium]